LIELHDGISGLVATCAFKGSG